MTARKDWQEAKKRYKSQSKNNTATASPPLNSDSAAGTQPPSDSSNTYQQEMDEMRCILYTHGGMQRELHPWAALTLFRRLLFW